MSKKMYGLSAVLEETGYTPSFCIDDAEPAGHVIETAVRLQSVTLAKSYLKYYILDDMPTLHEKLELLDDFIEYEQEPGFWGLDNEIFKKAAIELKKGLKD